MSKLQLFGMVLLTGALFTAGDIVSRKWGQDRSSIPLFLLMAAVGTAAYCLMGTMMRSAEFTKVAIWTSICLTSLSCLYGLAVVGDELTHNKVIAVLLALAACYFSAK